MQGFIYIQIEFLDELVFGVGAATTPLMRDDLALNYAQIGIFPSISELIVNFIGPFMFILGDVWKRRVITQAINNVSGMFGKLLPFDIGLAAQAFGLCPAIRLLLAGPLTLLVGLPHRYAQSLIPGI